MVVTFGAVRSTDHRQVAVKLLKGQGVEDVRSDDEDEDPKILGRRMVGHRCVRAWHLWWKAWWKAWWKVGVDGG